MDKIKAEIAVSNLKYSAKPALRKSAIGIIIFGVLKLGESYLGMVPEAYQPIADMLLGLGTYLYLEKSQWSDWIRLINSSATKNADLSVENTLLGEESDAPECKICEVKDENCQFHKNCE